MKAQPKVQRIGVIDDDEDSRATLVDLISDEFPKVTVRGYESIFDAYQGMMTIDFLLIDVSAVAPLMMGDVSRAWAPIGKFASEHPATEFVIISAMSRNGVEDVIDDCVNLGGVERRRLHYGGFQWTTSLAGEVAIQPTLRHLIKPEDTEWRVIKKRGKSQP